MYAARVLGGESNSLTRRDHGDDGGGVRDNVRVFSSLPVRPSPARRLHLAEATGSPSPSHLPVLDDLEDFLVRRLPGKVEEHADVGEASDLSPDVDVQLRAEEEGLAGDASVPESLRGRRKQLPAPSRSRSREEARGRRRRE
eukprot:764938-Hanusia_phi.AAC.2